MEVGFGSRWEDWEIVSTVGYSRNCSTKGVAQAALDEVGYSLAPNCSAIKAVSGWSAQLDWFDAGECPAQQDARV